MNKSAMASHTDSRDVTVPRRKEFSTDTVLLIPPLSSTIKVESIPWHFCSNISHSCRLRRAKQTDIHAEVRTGETRIKTSTRGASLLFALGFTKIKDYSRDFSPGRSVRFHFFQAGYNIISRNLQKIPATAGRVTTHIILDKSIPFL